MKKFFDTHLGTLVRDAAAGFLGAMFVMLVAAPEQQIDFTLAMVGIVSVPIFLLFGKVAFALFLFYAAIKILGKILDAFRGSDSDSINHIDDIPF
jgi:hypothetical protein